MSDKELVKHCMCGCMYLEAECPNCNKVTDADRIEALTAERDEALNQLDSARHSVDVLEKRVAFVEEERRKTFQALLKVTKIHDEVEAKLATCEKYRDAYAECDSIGTQAVRDLEAKLAKAVEALNYCINAPFSGWTIAQGYARTVLAEIEGLGVKQTG
jgi:septal ring factor EnvC (AmiA/AmiB activator)